MSEVLVSKADLARLAGVSLPTISQWVAKGCPYVKKGAKGQPWQFDASHVWAWREEQVALQTVGDTSQLDIEEARRRKLAAEAALAELDVAKKKGELVEVEVVAETVGDDYANVRAKLLSLPTKAAPQLCAIDDAAEVQSFLEKLVFEALEELTADGIYASVAPSADEAEEGES